MQSDDGPRVRVKTYRSGSKLDRAYKLADQVFAEDAQAMSLDGWIIRSHDGSNLTGITVTYVKADTVLTDAQPPTDRTGSKVRFSSPPAVEV